MTGQKQALDLEAVKQRRETAFEWVFAMCKGKTRFKMSIPYEETDTDAILCAALKDSETLAAEVETLREALSDLHRVLRERHHGYMPDEVREAYERAYAALNPAEVSS